MNTKTTSPPAPSGEEARRRILSLLRGDCAVSLELFEELGSTNDRAKTLGKSAAPAWSAVLARRQTAGRGRMGRGFFSPLGGVYCSLLLRPDCSARDAGLFTAAASLGVCRGIEAICGQSCQIKWPNDLILAEKKVGGILTEANLDPQGRIAFLVIGVGLNLRPPEGGFPKELPHAGALLAPAAPGPDFPTAAAGLLNALCEQLYGMPNRDFLAEYRRRSLLIGREVLVHQNGGVRPARVQGIGEDAGLIVLYSNGTLETLHSGEVTLREHTK